MLQLKLKSHNFYCIVDYQAEAVKERGESWALWLEGPGFQSLFTSQLCDIECIINSQSIVLCEIVMSCQVIVMSIDYIKNVLFCKKLGSLVIKAARGDCSIHFKCGTHYTKIWFKTCYSHRFCRSDIQMVEQWK